MPYVLHRFSSVRWSRRLLCFCLLTGFPQPWLVHDEAHGGFDCEDQSKWSLTFSTRIVYGRAHAEHHDGRSQPTHEPASYFNPETAGRRSFCETVNDFFESSNQQVLERCQDLQVVAHSRSIVTTVFSCRGHSLMMDTTAFHLQH